MADAAKVIPVTTAHIPKLVEAQRTFFNTGATRPLDYRLEQLKKLGKAIEGNEANIVKALRADLGRCETESFLCEIATTLEDLHFIKKNVRSWARPRRYATGLAVQPATSEVRPEPKGVVLTIAPWNYPFNLAFVPVLTSIAAGNTNIIKPSELAPAISEVIAKIVRENFDPAFMACVEGGVDESTALLDQHFDHILFTGGTSVGRIIMEKAAKHLTPVTLELGGKSPTIVTKNANLDHAVRRITWGKWVNAGQTCIAPDYVLVEKDVAPKFLEKLKARVNEIYGQNPQKSPDYARIINDRHCKRVASYIKDGNVAFGGQVDEKDRYIAPTIVTQPKLDSPLMQDEIFGPVLPVIEYSTKEEALAIMAARSRPLAMYVFSDKSSESEWFLSRQISGGACVNEVLLHFASPSIPFGGVGASGMGAYHGIRGFDEFSHLRSVVTRHAHFANPLLIPPYGTKLGMIKRLMKLMHLL